MSPDKKNKLQNKISIENAISELRRNVIMDISKTIADVELDANSKIKVIEHQIEIFNIFKRKKYEELTILLTPEK